MGIFGLLGSKDKGKIVDGTIDTVKSIIGMIDDSKLTSEEAMRANIGCADAMAQHAKDSQSQGTPSSKARRTIGIEYVRFFPCLVVFIIILKIVANYIPEIDGSAEFAAELVISMYLPAAFITIIAFFFGGYYLKQYTGREKTKK